jgi:hypothetical protein
MALTLKAVVEFITPYAHITQTVCRCCGVSSKAAVFTKFGYICRTCMIKRADKLTLFNMSQVKAVVCPFCITPLPPESKGSQYCLVCKEWVTTPVLVGTTHAKEDANGEALPPVRGTARVPSSPAIVP